MSITIKGNTIPVDTEAQSYIRAFEDTNVINLNDYDCKVENIYSALHAVEMLPELIDYIEMFNDADRGSDLEEEYSVIKEKYEEWKYHVNDSHSVYTRLDVNDSIVSECMCPNNPVGYYKSFKEFESLEYGYGCNTPMWFAKYYSPNTYDNLMLFKWAISVGWYDITNKKELWGHSLYEGDNISLDVAKFVCNHVQPSKYDMERFISWTNIRDVMEMVSTLKQRAVSKWMIETYFKGMTKNDFKLFESYQT
jgi:hypothetical protein